MRNNNVSAFDEVTNGTTQVFSMTGNNLTTLITIENNNTVSAPIIYDVRWVITPASAINVSADFGSDGESDWNFDGKLNSSNSPKTINGSIFDFENYRNSNCVNRTATCQLPISIITKSVGVISINLLNMTQRIESVGNTSGSIIIMNLSRLETITNWNWTTSFLNGFLTFYDLDIEFLGSKNITLFAHNTENSSQLLGTANLTLQIFYSKSNVTYPKGIVSFELDPLSNNQSNVTIVGQQINYCNTSVDVYCAHVSTPIFNATNYAYDDNIDMYVRVNASYNFTYFNFSLDIGVNRTTALQVNNSFQRFIDNINRFDLNVNNSKRVFGFVDFYNITETIANKTNFDFEWRPYCNTCVR